MRTTISIADTLFRQTQTWLGDLSFSDFVSEAIHRRVVELTRERLAQELEEGYQAEAANPSLALEWATIEVDGL